MVSVLTGVFSHMTITIKPPSRIRPDPNQESVFLAGAIDNGTARDWRSELMEYFDGDDRYNGLVFYNPLADNWDPNLQMSITCERFEQQVNWELDMLRNAFLVVFFFPAESVAPISLFELGFVCDEPDRVMVVAEEGYWRRGNLEVICNRQGIVLGKDLVDMVTWIKEHV